MTEIQNQVFDECCEKLGEHFDAFVLVTAYDDDDSKNDIIHTHYRGGFAKALGLSEIVKLRLVEERKKFPEEGDIS